MKIGYDRVSSDEQNLELQSDALKAAGRDVILEDAGISGSVERQPGRDRALVAIEKGDALVTCHLDFFGRPLPHLINLVTTLKGRGAEFASLNEAVDTNSAGRKLIFHIMGALAEFERSLIIERTRAGIAAAKRRGQHLGHRRLLTTSQIDHARQMIEAGSETLSGMASLLGVGRATLWWALKE